MTASFVVTGGARGVGRAIAERLSDDGRVIVVDLSRRRGRGRRRGRRRRARPRRRARRAGAGRLGQQRRGLPRRGAARRAVGRTRRADRGQPRARRRGRAGRDPGVPGDGVAGAIVNVSSHQAQRAVPGALPYATAKAAIEGLTRALAVDYGPRGIRTNAVALGSIVTERYDPSLDDGARARSIRSAGAGRAAEVAEVVAYLLSPAPLRQRRGRPGRRRPRRARHRPRGARPLVLLAGDRVGQL